MASEIVQVKAAADQRLGRLADHHLPRLGQRCSRAARFGVSPTTVSSCDVPSPISSPTTTSPVAMPTRPASPSPAGVVNRATASTTKARPHRSFGLVLMRPRPTEIGQHTVSHELGDVALEARDLAGDGVLIGADDRAHLFGIELRRQGRRADQIDEHHGELAPLGTAGGRRGGQGLRCQLLDGRQQLFARSQGNAEFLEVRITELGQYLGIDLAVLERGLERSRPSTRSQAPTSLIAAPPTGFSPRSDRACRSLR